MNDDEDDEQRTNPQPEPNPSVANQRQQEQRTLNDDGDAEHIWPMLVDEVSAQPAAASDANVPTNNVHIVPEVTAQTQVPRVDENISSAPTPSSLSQEIRRRSQDQQEQRKSCAERSDHMQTAARSPALSHSSRHNASRSPALSRSSRHNVNGATPPTAAGSSNSVQRSRRVSVAPRESESRDPEWEEHENAEADREVLAIARKRPAVSTTVTKERVQPDAVRAHAASDT